MRKATSLLSRLSGSHHPVAGPGWWEYFGSFGDDFFTDEDINDDTTETGVIQGWKSLETLA